MIKQLKTGGQILVDALIDNGVDIAYCVPGESFLEVLDAMYDRRDRLRLISCRHEGAAAFMAEAHAKATGKPGVCFVTRGPGACNASIGLHTAHQDSSPMVLFVGQIARDAQERGAFQEIDYRRMFHPVAKWVAQIDDAARVPELVTRAFQVATSGRPGPVVLALPEDMLTEAVCPRPARAHQMVEAQPHAESMRRLESMLEKASAPLLILGGGGWHDDGLVAMRDFAQRSNIPVACSFRRQDLFDHRHPNYVGELGLGMNPALAQLVRRSDLILAVGARLGDVPTDGYTLLDVPKPVQQLVHVLPGAEDLGSVYQPDLPVLSGLNAFAGALKSLGTSGSPGRTAWLEQARANYVSWVQPSQRNVRLDPADVFAALRDLIPRDAILTNGAGNYSAWAHRYYQFSHPRSQLAPTSGAMGYGLPAAIAGKLAHPNRTVICLAGDGCFMMTAQELATAVQQQLAIVILVLNNGMYGTIRMHQETHYPGRPHGTDLHNPDFVAMACSFGAAGEHVVQASDFPAAVGRALQSKVPYLIELQIDAELISPRTTLTALRQKAVADIQSPPDSSLMAGVSA